MISATLTLDRAVQHRWDAVIIGAGPAGALAAQMLASRDMQVLLVERKKFPRGKVCGACLNVQALSVLRSAGMNMDVERLRGVPLREFRMRAAGREAVLPVSGGQAISRACLDAALVDAATQAGADFLPETTAHIESVHEERRTVRLEQRGSVAHTAAHVVLVAEGLGCAEPNVEMGSVVDTHSRVGAGCVLDEAPLDYTPGTIWMGIGSGGYVGLVRVEDGRLNVAAAFDRDFVRNCGAPGAAAIKVLSESGLPPIAGLESGTWQGTMSLTRRLSVPASERVLVIGDAAGYVEPFTGEGIAWALESAQRVVPLALRGIEAWNPSLHQEWQILLKQLLHRRQWMCRHLAVGLRRPWLVNGAVRVLSRFPGLAQPVIHVLNALAIPERGQTEIASRGHRHHGAIAEN